VLPACWVASGESSPSVSSRLALRTHDRPSDPARSSVWCVVPWQASWAALDDHMRADVKIGAVRHPRDCTKIASEPLNRRQRRSFESEISSAEIIGTNRYILRKRGLPAGNFGNEIKGEISPRIKGSDATLVLFRPFDFQVFFPEFDAFIEQVFGHNFFVKLRVFCSQC
jgi:hypothetical protein